MKRRVFALILACVLTLSLCACGKKEESNNTGETVDGKTVWYMGGKNFFSDDVDVPSLFEGVEDSIDPAKIYNSLELTEEMLHGVYTLNNKEKDLKTVRETIPYEEVAFKSGAAMVTILPTAVYFGEENICNSDTRYKYDEFREVADYEVAVLELAAEDTIVQTPCVYEISGNTITFKEVVQTSGAEEPFAYEFTGIEFTYDFALFGPYITFSKGGSSLKLMAYCLTENTDDSLWMDGYSLPDSPLTLGLDYFSSADAWNYAVGRDGHYFDVSAYKMTDDGRFTVYLADKAYNGDIEQELMGQYAYIIQSSADSFMTSFSVILLDGDKVYYYTDNITKREARALEEQGVDVDAMTEDEIKEIAEKKVDLFDDLYNAFEEQGINATINRSTGEISLDSTVLFGVNESEISDEGKAFLQKFMEVYTSVVFDEKYENFVSSIMVEGHTDTNGGYEMNLELSQARADSVKEYCLSSDCGIDPAYTEALQTMLEAVGYAYDKPVYDENGEVDMDASRRVSFRFIVNVEEQGQE